MTKAELISAIANGTGLTKADSERALNSFLAAAKNTIKKRVNFP